MTNFFLPRIETRTIDIKGIPTYIVKGYATTTGNVYPYKVTDKKTFKEYFTENAIKSINRKSKSKKIFVDIEHQIATKENSKRMLESIQNKTGKDFTEEIDYITRSFKYSEIPMFKVENIKIDDIGLFVEVRGNPFYRDISNEHKTYFDAVWGSLENGFINGMSLNMKPTKIINVTDDIVKIDDVDVYGISLTGSPSNDMATITEVAMRSIEIVRGGKKCRKKIKTTSLMM